MPETSTSLSRRTVIGAGLAAIWGGALSRATAVPAASRHVSTKRPSTSSKPTASPASPPARWRFAVGGYGPLVADPAGIIDLPAGFRYVTLVEPGSSRLDGGAPAPGRPDAMGSVRVGSTTFVAINHELNVTDGPPVPHADGSRAVAIYDAQAAGGVTVLAMDDRGTVTGHRAVLAGTTRNCAGGLTPWGTWLTCEESELDADGVAHGYVFEVDLTGDRTTSTPYRAMGRFLHEAATVDPKTSEVYLTEDGGPSALVYRFSPTDRSQRFGSLGGGGVLSAMHVPGIRSFAELRTVGQSIPGVGWTTTPNTSGAPSPQDPVGLKARFADEQVTRGQKLEGAWFHDGSLTFISSFDDSHGDASLRHEGQVFRYDPTTSTLTLLAYLPVGGRTTIAGETMSSPDNVSVSTFGGVVWCEDGADPNGIGALDADGQPFVLARSRQPGELCGVHFSPDGRWLFVNQQVVGRTLAIEGPWAPTTAVTSAASKPKSATRR
jgi:uncharacterized protein